jgi:hypothetical protein
MPAVWRVPFEQHPGVDQDQRLLAEEYPGRSGDALSNKFLQVLSKLVDAVWGTLTVEAVWTSWGQHQR